MLNQATGFYSLLRSRLMHRSGRSLIPFSMGERWFCLDNEVRQSVEALTDLIATQNVTHAILPPALAGLIPTGSLSNLRTLIVGGEACTPDIISRFAGGLRLIQCDMAQQRPRFVPH